MGKSAVEITSGRRYEEKAAQEPAHWLRKQGEVTRLEQESFSNMLVSKILNVDKEVYMVTTGNQHAFPYWACQVLGEVPTRKRDRAGKMGFQLHTALKV